MATQHPTTLTNTHGATTGPRHTLRAPFPKRVALTWELERLTERVRAEFHGDTQSPERGDRPRTVPRASSIGSRAAP